MIYDDDYEYEILELDDDLSYLITSLDVLYDIKDSWKKLKNKLSSIEDDEIQEAIEEFDNLLNYYF